MINYTGEQFIPGKTSKRIEQDFLARYVFAFPFAHNKYVLDLACGAGYGSKLLKERGCAKQVDGVDVSSDIIEYAKNNFSADGINFYLGNISDFGTNNTYDLITCFETIEHVNAHEHALKNLYRILKPGGVLLISTPNRLITSPYTIPGHKPEGSFHAREWTVDELLTEVVSAGFDAKKEEVYGNRQQWYFKNRYLRRIYKILFKPDIKYSPDFKKLHASPRFFILVARKPS